MSPDRIDLLTLLAQSPEDLRWMPLEIALLYNVRNITFAWAERLSQETDWKLFPLASLEHAIPFFKKTVPHVLVIHWHTGWDHNYNSPVTRLVRGIKRRRGKPGIGRGPLIVGTYHQESCEEIPSLMPFLKRTYDCLLEFGESTHLAAKLIDALWNYLQIRARIPAATAEPG